MSAFPWPVSASACASFSATFRSRSTPPSRSSGRTNRSCTASTSSPDGSPLMISLGAAAILAAALMTREVAVTFDDLPAVPKSIPIARQQTLTRDLLRSIKTAGVPAVGFVNENKLESNGKVDPRKVKLLEQWLAAGLELGNHTYSHPDLHHVDVSAFEKDIVKGERTTRKLQKKLRWFRHPFLHTGRSLETRTRVEELLRKRGM